MTAEHLWLVGFTNFLDPESGLDGQPVSLSYPGCGAGNRIRLAVRPTPRRKSSTVRYRTDGGENDCGSFRPTRLSGGTSPCSAFDGQSR